MSETDGDIRNVFIKKEDSEKDIAESKKDDFYLCQDLCMIHQFVLRRLFVALLGV